ncbi:hypothetical protein D3C73_1386410 [compost metagenome]
MFSKPALPFLQHAPIQVTEHRSQLFDAQLNADDTAGHCVKMQDQRFAAAARFAGSGFSDKLLAA